MSNKNRFLYQTKPLALLNNIVSGNKYRFTILTPSLIRLEYNEDGMFEDRASQTVFFRDFSETDFNKTHNDEFLKIETKNLIITYKENKPFASDTLSIKLKIEPASTWNYGDRFEDLGGTAQTLDKTNGGIPLDHGVCSRYGFSVIDDSRTLVLNEEGWVETRVPNSIDCYFWGYGFQYIDAVKDFYRLTGAPPLLPAYALGNWWSRYHEYTQEEYQGLIERFEKEEIPFSVAIVDMDWHITQLPEESTGDDPRFTNGWTGYTWNKELFPDYKSFLKFLESHNLKTALNLHPAQGVGCHEEMYKEMALACGIDPNTKQRVKFDILSQKFMENYFDILHHPYENAGVNFWWMDWQQGTNYWWIHEENKDGKMQDEREALNPLWMLNHLHIADIRRNGKRPMFFSRYSGPGSHRYPVGFSGDTAITWEALDYQPYFTSTASNIGYSWWSHDIGGHMKCYQNDELMIRWVQYGVFSPINRLHSSNERFSGKEPWKFGPEAERIMKNWLRMRHKLFPYIYAMNYRNHVDLLPFIQPMYYAYPKRSAAYDMKNQFMFGSELMVAPITQPSNPHTHHGTTEVWFPEGDWFDFFSGLHYTSNYGRTMKITRSLDDYPVFAKAGAIVPMQDSHDLKAGNDLNIIVFPGADNYFALYEDAGEGDDYSRGDYAITEMYLDWKEKAIFTIQPSTENCKLLPESRNFCITLRGFHKSISVKVFVDDTEVNVTPIYDGQTLSVSIKVKAATFSEIKMGIVGEELITDNGDLLKRCETLLQKMEFSYLTREELYNYIALDDVPLKYTYDEKMIRKLANLYHYASIDPSYNGVVDTLVEQLLLIDTQE